MFDNSSRATLVVVAIVQFLVSLDLSVVNVGLPQIALGLGFSTVGLPWVIHAYVLTFGGLAWFGLISPDGTFVTDVLGPSIVAGVGFGLCLGPVVATATAGVAPQESGTASGLLTSSRQIGASLGLAALGTAAHSRTGEGITPATLNDGYALGLTLCAALLVAAVLIALTVLRSGRPTTPLGPLAAPAAAHRAG
jgi:hypothetical protein